MTPHQTMTRRRTTTLHRYNLARDRYYKRTNSVRGVPTGAAGEDWQQWRQWVLDYHAILAAIRDSELERLRQHKEAMNERKRKRNANRG